MWNSLTAKLRISSVKPSDYVVLRTVKLNGDELIIIKVGFD
jgi:hypothetical protein